ncbi:hypothetical protein [Paraprevotella xylaniphila]|uniref:hypothetical protein n=1 Tax=Paraprevotella xylaniphila TaxID=454155 RepID=UPI00266D6F41|nr:hypothetical protein [Paraprevotella xylaniphila]
MKKQVLSVWVFCSALGIAQAQTDVTKEYLINPSFETLKAADGATDVAVKTTLENGLQGWEVASMSNYQVESEESGSSTGFPADGSGKIKPTEGTYYYFNRQGWGNKNSELKTTTSKELPAGTYYAVIDYKAADYSNNNTDKNGTTIGIKANSADNKLLGEKTAVRLSHSLVAGGSNPGSDAYMVNAAWDELGTMFTVTEPTTVTISLVQNMKNSGRSDIAWDNLRLYKVDNVDKDHPMDLNGLIPIANYEVMGDWKIEGGNEFKINTWSHEGETDGSGMVIPFFQDWVGSGSIAADATISNSAAYLKPGIYEVSALIRVLNEAGGAAPSGATLYANEGSTDACAGTSCTNGVYGTYTVKGTVGTDGVLTFGIKVANANFNWVSFKDFRLQYLGAASIDQLKATLKEKMTEAQAYVADSPKGIAAIVNAAIAQGNNTQDTEESLNAAITALTQAITLAEQAAPVTEAFKALMATCQSYANHSSAEESVKQAFQKAMTDAQAALDAATTVEAIQETIQPLQTACETYILNAIPEKGYPFDYTFLMDEANNSGNGWTKNVSQGNIQNFNYKESSEKNNGKLQKTGFMEAWDANPYAATLTYTRNELPNGHYKVSSYAFTTVNGNTSFTANGKKVTMDNSTALYTNPTIEDVIVDEGKLTVGLNTSDANWTGITNIQLQYLSQLTDAEASAKAKEALYAKLEEAGNMDTETNVGTEAFQIPETAVEAFDAAFDKANDIYTNSQKVDEIEAATKALDEAIKAFQNPVLNAPKEGELFCIANISEGFAYKNNAVSPIYNEAKANDGEYDLKWFHIVDANYAQALKFTPVEGQQNQYTISFTDEEGNTRYFSTQALAGYIDTDKNEVSTRHDRIRATKEAEKALPFEISLAREGVYKLKNTLHGSNIGSTNDDGFFTTNNLSDLSLVKAEKANVTLSITAAGWCTLILPFDAEIPQGFEVYSCTGTEVPVGTSTALVLEKAESIEAHTPYIVKGKEGDTYDLSEYGTALKDQYATGLMTGTFTQQKAVANTYVLQNQEGKVGFYKVMAGSEPTIKPYRAYINADVAEANIVALLLPGIGTGIDGIVAEDALVNVYDLNGILVRENVKLGQALEGLSKGIYIVNGTKKAVK